MLDVQVVAITNNWKSDKEEEKYSAISQIFNVFVESCVVGFNKPDKRIFQVALRQLNELVKGERSHNTDEDREICFEECIFLDDIGRNLKAAKELGMSTIKVTDPMQGTQILLNPTLVVSRAEQKRERESIQESCVFRCVNLISITTGGNVARRAKKKKERCVLRYGCMAMERRERERERERREVCAY